MPKTARHSAAGSPSWHRRARKRRAVARKRIWASRRQGLSLPRREIALLEGHHSAPAYCCQMGGKRWPKQDSAWSKGSGQDGWERWESYQQSPSRPWRLWPGAKASPKSKDRYDAMAIQTKPTKEEPPAPSIGDTFPGLQKALTSTHRADVKLRKLREEKERRALQWDAWAADQKTKFMRQRKMYEQDVARIEKELQETVEHGRMAAAQVHALVVHGAAPMAVEERQDYGPAWEALWNQVAAPAADPVCQPGGFLQEALEAVRTRGPAGPPLDTRALPPPGLSAPSVDSDSVLRYALALKMQEAARTAAPAPPASGPDTTGLETAEDQPMYSGAKTSDPYLASPGGAFAKLAPAVSPSARVAPYENRGHGDDEISQTEAARLEAHLQARRAAALGASSLPETSMPTHPGGSAPVHGPAAAKRKAMTAFGKVVINGQQRLSNLTIQEDDDDLSEPNMETTHGGLPENGT